MKRSTKVMSIILIFFLIIAIVIVGRTMIGNHFKKKFSKRPPPGIIVTEVIEKEFSEKIETFGTAISKKSETFKIKKEDLRSERFNLTLNDFSVSNKELAIKLGEDYVHKSPLQTELFPNTFEILRYLKIIAEIQLFSIPLLLNCFLFLLLNAVGTSLGLTNITLMLSLLSSCLQHEDNPLSANFDAQ